MQIDIPFICSTIDFYTQKKGGREVQMERALYRPGRKFASQEGTRIAPGFLILFFHFTGHRAKEYLDQRLRKS